MGGTLEEKKTSVLEVNVEREKWMDKPIEEKEKIRLLKGVKLDGRLSKFNSATFDRNTA